MDWLNTPASLQAGVLAEVGWVLVAGATAIFVLTMGLLVLALRRRKREIPTVWWTVGAGVAFPSVVLGALLIYDVLRTAELDRPPTGAPVVIGITGHLWWWEIRYHDPASGRWIVGANELRLPAGRAVQLGLESADVIHSFWVPTLGGKMDLVPGRTNRLLITALEPGVHRGVCAEYCGTQHARMALHVVVETPEQFDRWLAAQSAAASTPPNATIEQGRRAFLDHGCAGCHVVRGLAEGSSLGPDLTHVGSRLHLGAGTLPNDRDRLARWIANPQEFKPGTRMPSFQHLDSATLDALADYLSHLR